MVSSLAVALLAVASALAPQGPGCAIPERIQGAAPGHPPEWVALESIRVDGGLDWSQLPAQDVPFLKELLRRAANRVGESDAACPVTFSAATGGVEALAQGLVELRKRSRAVVVGTITSVVPGFFNGRPGSMLLLEQAGAGESAQTTLAFFPAGRFTVGSATFCVTTATDFVPAPGDSVLAFVTDEQPNGRFLRFSSSATVFDRPTGRTAPPALSGDPMLGEEADLVTLLERVEAAR